jgi:hypothetical protein
MCYVSGVGVELMASLSLNDRDLNCELGLDFGPSLKCGKEEGKE